MFPVSTQLAAALAGPGPAQWTAYAELWQGTPKAKVATVELSGGKITWDRNSATRGSCQVTVPTLDALVPDTPFTGSDRRFGDGTFGSGLFGDYRRRYLRGVLLPLMTEIRVFWQGLLPGTSTWETVPLGRYTVTDPVFNDAPEGDTVTITGYDASSDIAAALWQAPYTIAAGTNVGTALTALLQNRLPGLVVNVPATTETTGQMIYTPGGQSGRNPWQDAQALAALAGWVLFIDRDGSAVATTLPDPATGSPVWSLTDDGTALRFKSSPSAADLVNTVIVYGENSDHKPFTVTVQDTTGPYGTGSLGRVLAREYRSDAVTSTTQATLVGNHLLRQWGAMTETVEMDTFPAPHLDPGDLVTVRSDGLQFDDDVYAADRIEVNLDPANPASKVTVSRRL